MKILFITDLYPVKSSEKITPKTLSNFVEDWKSFGHDVSVYKPNFLLNSFIRRKPFYKTGQYEDVFNANYITPFWGNIQNKSKTFFSKNFDIIVAHMPSGILFADKLELPFIAGIHSSDLTVLTNPLYKFHFKKRLVRALVNANGIACRSSVIKNKLLKLYPQFEDKTFVAPSGIEEKYIIDNFLSNIQPDRLKIVTCANFKKRKNIDKLILALKDIDGVDLTVIGDGNDRKKLEHLNDNNKFLGRLSNERVLEVMRNSDVFILPSVGETFGMVYLEAMASGCITVCTKDDGVDGIIKNGINGFTVEPDLNSIRDCVLKLKGMGIEELNMIRKNSLETVRHYTRMACSAEYLENIHKFIFR